MGLPLVLTEADSHLGLANRLLARWASSICLAFPIPGRDQAQGYRVVGRPVPRAVLEADRGKARERFGIAEDEPCLLVFGGSLGARSINEAAIEAFGEGTARVLHVAGRRDYPELMRRWERAGSPKRYELIEYEPHLGDVLAASDLVVARAGGSVFEIAAAGRPAVLVPYPHATADHQTANARWMADAGGAVTIADAELTAERLRAVVLELLADPDRLARMREASRRIARPDAAESVAAEVLSAAGAATRER
jgi:UDP-N-acetylglucosamine--N-acetylmuramyl-(pentapeptide) pyrophosphoryl-undecaprenol N-acetylglucosamine transferase